MTLEIVTTEAGFAALEPVWDKLLDASSTHSPFLAWDYVRLWWQHFAASFQLCLGVVRDEQSNVIGIAPFIIGSDRGESRQHLRHLGFMNGLGDCQGERLDLLVAAGQEEAVTPLLASVISRSSHRWDVVRLNKVPEESPNFRFLLAEMHRAGTQAGVLNQSVCRCLDLPESWEVFEMSKSGNFRRNLRRNWTHLFEKLDAGVMMEMPPDEASREFFRLHAMHWPDGVSSFLRAPTCLIHAELIRCWLPQGRIMMPFILVDGRPVGSVYALCHRGEVFIYQLGWDKAYAGFSMGNLSVRAVAVEAIRREMKLVDFLPGEYRYKRDWSGRTRVVSDLEVFHRWRPRSLAFLLLRTIKRRFYPDTAAPNPGSEVREPAQEPQADLAS